MAIPCSTSDFTVTFIYPYGEDMISNFVDSLEDWEEGKHSFVVIPEYIELEMIFTCNNADARCYMDGFEVLSTEDLHLDEKSGEHYIKPDQRITLYKKSGYYPYIPGIYSVKVVCSNKTYYSLVKVMTNRLTSDQLDSMRMEVESNVRGLALDVVRKQKAFYTKEDIPLDPTLFQQFSILDSHFPEISAILADLSKRIRFSLVKEYNLQPAERPAQVDDVSIRHRLRHPESTSYVKSPKKKVNYNLSENRVLKAIIEKWLRLLRDFEDGIDSALSRYDNRGLNTFSSYTPFDKRMQYINELKGYRDRAAQIKGGLTILKASRWYLELSGQSERIIPTMMYADVRYRFIWQLDRLLFSEDMDLSLHQNWRYHWKRTDQLYEIWCYLKILQTLRSDQYGFSYTSGWLFNQSQSEVANVFVIPTIPKGTTVKLTKGDLQLSVVYENVIPKTPNETDQYEIPIYTTGENTTPDIRIDVYIQSIFVGTILLDAKYRKMKEIWDTDKGQSTRRQLTSYADNIRSPYIFNKKRRWEKFRPVHQVLVLYPEKWGETEVEAKKGRSISLIPLTPETDLTVFNQTIEKLIEELIYEAEDEGIVTNTRLIERHEMKVDSI